MCRMMAVRTDWRRSIVCLSWDPQDILKKEVVEVVGAREVVNIRIRNHLLNTCKHSRAADT